PERRARLDAIPGWAWDAQDAKWEKGFLALRSFAEREGHMSPPNGHVEHGVLLPSWIQQQREKARQGRIREDRKQRLEALPGWLSDATAVPTFVAVVTPGRSVTKVRQCRGRGYWSDVNAYRWDGGALAAQRWNSDRTVMRWARVTFDGITFRNGGRTAVLVA